MKNKTTKILVAFAAIAILTLGAATAQTWQSGDCTVTLENGVLTVSGNGAMADYSRDDQSTAPWWNSHEQVSSIVVSDGVTHIGNYTFAECSNATSITLPNSVTTIGASAFIYCESLTSVTIPNSVTSIEDYAFFSCSNLTSITLPNSLTTIGQLAFSRCTNLPSITLPNSLTTIGGDAFDGCTGLTSVTLPNSLTTIGRFAFSSCTNLPSITLPNSLTTIEDNAFFLCSNLTSITLPSSLTSIDHGVFLACYSMTDVYLTADPANLTWTNEYNGTVYDDFKANKATLCHVPAKWLSAYQQKFSHINVTFVGDLALTYILSDIPAGWTVTADGQPVEVNANGEAVIEEGASVVVTPSDRDKPRVKSVSIVPNN